MIGTIKDTSSIRRGVQFVLDNAHLMSPPCMVYTLFKVSIFERRPLHCTCMHRLHGTRGGAASEVTEHRGEDIRSY